MRQLRKSYGYQEYMREGYERLLNDSAHYGFMIGFTQMTKRICTLAGEVGIT
jgi:hypothetical protein